MSRTESDWLCSSVSKYYVRILEGERPGHVQLYVVEHTVEIL